METAAEVSDADRRVKIKLPKLIATSVVRGTQQGESHGGVYTVDFEQREVVQHVDWNASGIDFEGRGASSSMVATSTLPRAMSSSVTTAASRYRIPTGTGT